MYRYFGLLYYMAVVNLPVIHLYWSTAALFHGTWARSFISSRRRFQQISSFLKVSNHEMEDKDDKLCKVRILHDYISSMISLQRPLELSAFSISLYV